jgi:hypothetical protein
MKTDRYTTKHPARNLAAIALILFVLMPLAERLL